VHLESHFTSIHRFVGALFLALWCVANVVCGGPSAEGSAALPAPVADAADQSPDATAAAMSDATQSASSAAEVDANAGSAAQDPPPPIPAMPAELVNNVRWLRVDASADPFDDRPHSVVCDLNATLPELFNGVSAYGIDTGACNYATVHQPILRAVAAGETVTVRLVHFELTAPEDSEAHVALTIDGLPVLDERIPIPSASQVLVRALVAPRAILAGASAYFHVHNHGANSYALISLSAGR
jgi:hypothetical protein